MKYTQKNLPSIDHCNDYYCISVSLPCLNGGGGHLCQRNKPVMRLYIVKYHKI